jgi:S-(hydroxymethyl)glutathione dehydrogenase/alcohol dehydrogenase
MKAVILEEINKPLKVKEVSLTELKVGQVLVKILVSGLCGAQLQEIAGLKGNSNFVPHLLGHEGCGLVEEVGPGVTTVKIGDKVVMHWRKGDGIESDFPNYILEDRKISSGKVTTLSEYSIVSENRITKVPNDTSEYLCALLGCGLTTALGIINNEAELKFGESILVIGCGGVGLNILQGAKLATAYPIIGIDNNEDKRKMSENYATHFINLSIDNLSEKLKEIGILKFDVIVDTTGINSLISKTLPFLSDSGRYILVGQTKPGQSIDIENAIHLFGGNGKTIKATQGGKTSPSEDISRYIKLHKAGLINIDNIITHEFYIDDINDAFDILRSGKAGRIMIKMNK